MMIGGFLGAGKTTAMAAMATRLLLAGQRVGLVTNDQAENLVDTQTLRSLGFKVGEVSGACFCCSFDKLVETIATVRDQARPDIIIAEPVGSCTDLAATVIEPLRQLHHDHYDLAPLAVLLKPEHGLKILKHPTAGGFSAEAAYVFLKQIEEADIVAINKVDKLSAADRTELTELVHERFPGKTVLTTSFKTGSGVDSFMEALQAPSPPRSKFMTLDYETYAAGEADLGWLNASYTFQTLDQQPVELDRLVVALVSQLAESLIAQQFEPAHLKIAATDGDRRFALANVVGSEVAAELSQAALASAAAGGITVNARVATDPVSLEATTTQVLHGVAAQFGFELQLRSLASFSPAPPEPMHRYRSQ